MYDLIIIGMGISGISAGIYAKNGGLNVLLLDKDMPGGLLNKISKVNNYPGYRETTGPDLAMELFETVNYLKIPYQIAEVKNIMVHEEEKIVETTNGAFSCKYLIIATGRKNRKLGLSNEEKLLGRGISTCALCDGNLYKGREVAVVGGGNSALEEALYLANIVKKVYLIHRRDTFKAEESLVKEIKKKKNIEILYNSNITEIIEEENKVKEIVLNEKKHLKVAAMFTSIGFEPSFTILEDLQTDKFGYIEVNEDKETNLKGIYAVGDCIKKDIYQLITAANDGVVASIHIMKEIKKK